MGIFRDQWVVLLFLENQFLKLREALLELLFGWRILSDGVDQLNSVQSGLIALIVKESNDFVQFVQVINLNLALLLLSEGGESSG